MQPRFVDRFRVIRGNTRFFVVLGYIATLFIAGLVWPGDEPVLRGLWRIILEPGVLITDYMAIAGPGAAFVNSALVGLVGLAMVILSGAPVSGPTMAAVFTMMGFALFGKSIFNIFPIITGVFLISKFKKESFRHFILVAMFGTALSPLVSHVAFSLKLGTIWGIILGMAAGALLPDLAGHFIHVHGGFNLYNVGFTSGFIGTFATTQLRSFGQVTDVTLIWSTGYTQPLTYLMAGYFVSMIVLGLALEGDSLKRLWHIFRQPGLLVSDFVQNAGFGPALVNMGLVGLIGLGYVLLVRGPLNGPVIGGLLTMVGFAAFGKHPVNIVPVMLGVFLGTRVKIWNAYDPGPILAALFGTTLAPISGTFGPIFGVLAGYLHLGLVMHIGWLHGGVNLYNNGFSGGIVAAVLITAARMIGLPGNRMVDWLGGKAKNAE